jgi:hypothetical protein
MEIEEIINIPSIVRQVKKYGKSGPFDHCVIDDFFLPDVAKSLEKEFPDYNDPILFKYKNAIENKKTSNNWNIFPAFTYSIFTALNSYEFVNYIEELIPAGVKLYSDPGLNGGGWHIHKNEGKLNTHLDYSVHPKINLQRKLNLIIYLNSEWKDDWGGDLGMWGSESKEKPGKLARSVSPKFNRAIIFDTTQNSWHGLPEPITCPEGQYRKSIAIYYLCDVEAGTDERGKALFYPTKIQENDEQVLQLIKKRADMRTYQEVYIDEK